MNLSYCYYRGWVWISWNTIQDNRAKNYCVIRTSASDLLYAGL